MSVALTVPHRFHGPPRSGNGGWTAGALAERLSPDGGTPITVALRLPPPLDTPLGVVETDGVLTAELDGRPVVQARPAAADPTPVAPVSLDAATDAATRYRGFEGHPFPSCFTCGPDREPGDGLRIFPGKVADDETRSAAPWTPYDVTVPITWAALDCSGGWASDVDERPMVLGTMTLRIDHPPVTGEHYVLVGEERGREGRKTFTASSLYDYDGGLRATAEHVWITIDLEAF